MLLRFLYLLFLAIAHSWNLLGFLCLVCADCPKDSFLWVYLCFGICDGPASTGWILAHPLLATWNHLPHWGLGNGAFANPAVLWIPR